MGLVSLQEWHSCRGHYYYKKTMRYRGSRVQFTFFSSHQSLCSSIFLYINDIKRLIWAQKTLLRGISRTGVILLNILFFALREVALRTQQPSEEWTSEWVDFL